jgi:putative intracellular protease/amidase
MAKKVSVVLFGFGYWGEELIGPIEALDAASYKVEFLTPLGTKPAALRPSMDDTYIDPQLGRPVTTKAMAEKVKAIEKWDRLANRKNLSECFPERPYFSAQMLVRELEDCYNKRDAAGRDLDQYAALLLVGGSGPIVDMVNNRRVRNLILGFHRAGKPIPAECYGVACLAFARDMEDRKSIIRDRHVTGHCLEYDYKDGTGFLGTWARRHIPFNKFCETPRRRKALVTAISAGKSRLYSITRSSPEGRRPIHSLPVKNLFKYSKMVCNGMGGRNFCL